MTVKIQPIKEISFKNHGIYKEFNRTKKNRQEALTIPALKSYRMAFKCTIIQEDTVNCMGLASAGKSFDFWK